MFFNSCALHPRYIQISQKVLRHSGNDCRSYTAWPLSTDEYNIFSELKRHVSAKPDCGPSLSTSQQNWWRGHAQGVEELSGNSIGASSVTVDEKVKGASSRRPTAVAFNSKVVLVEKQQFCRPFLMNDRI